MRMATCSGPEVSNALLKYFHNELQMWLCVYFLLVILIFSLFPSSLLQQTQIHNLDLIKKQRLLIQRRTCRHVTELLSEKPSGKDSLWNTWHPFSKRAAEVPAKPEILHITILILSEERYFQFLPLQLFCRVYGASCCILFSSRVWFILPSEGQIWNSITILEVFIGWEIIHSLIFKVNQIAQFNYRNNIAKDVVISVLWLFLSAFSWNTYLS